MLKTMLLIATLANTTVANSQSTCAPTVGTDQFSPSLPESENWYGSEALAVRLPVDGVWPTTPAGALISVKLMWWSTGFRPGMESNLHVTVRSLSGEPVTAVVSRPTNAHDEPLGWTMLTGMRFPDPGCWEITGEYLGQTLTFVIETVANKPITNLHELLERVEAQPRAMLEHIRSQSSSDPSCDISEDLNAVERRSAAEAALQSVAQHDFRYLFLPAPDGRIVPGIVYDFEFCSDTASHLKLALSEGENRGGFCQERAVLGRIALDFAGEYNSLMRQHREDRGIAVCTTI